MDDEKDRRKIPRAPDNSRLSSKKDNKTLNDDHDFDDDKRGPLADLPQQRPLRK